MSVQHQTGFYVCRTAVDGSACEIEVRADATAPGFWHAMELVQGACEYALWVHLLGLGRGVILHASSVVADGRSLAFSGREQAGKTSFAKIMGAAGFGVAHDESTLLTLEGDRVLTWSHPLRRRAFAATPLCAKTSAVAFIRPGGATRIRRLPEAESVMRLLYHSGVRSARYLDEKGGRRAHVLNEVGAEIWQLADGTRDLKTITAALTEAFDGPHEEMERDVHEFLAQLAELGLCQLDAGLPREGENRA